ncbi:unnamed protein product [Adineta ricciae]|uniref:Uncharacterized protein n=1 Tax=Adineta ricciae TaxID=249248 RepID=A0A816BWG1_ADIRI|nr:unnamed protein product [Adineta ricciae]CAF1616898.1 unnamed protein product [Adineta ricciae]
MASQYPSTFIQQYPTKIAFLIDCAGGLNGFSLSSRFMDNFPPNSDIFLFYPNSEPGMNRRLKRIESDSHGVFFFPTLDYGIECTISFLLGQINDKYDAFTLVTSYHPAFENICHQLIANRSQLKNHIQVRSFENINQFEQFLKELIRLQNDTETSKTNKKTVVNYSKKHLFHSCPFESKQDSTILYRLGDFLHHLDTEHANVHYDYCTDCEQLENDPQSLEGHIQEKHWKANGFHVNIRSS